MNIQMKADRLMGTNIYQSGSFNQSEAAQAMKVPTHRAPEVLEYMVEAGDLHVVSEFLWAKPSRGLPFHWRRHPMFPWEAENRQCLVLS